MEKVGVWTDSRDNKKYDVYKTGSQWWIPMFTYNSEDGFYTTSEALAVIPDGWQIAKQLDWIKLVGVLGGLKEVFFDFPKEWKGFVDPKGVVHNPQDDSNKANYYITGEENPVIFKKFTETIEYMNMTYPNVGYASGEVYHHKDDWASYKGLLALVTYTDPLVQNTLKSAPTAAPEPIIGTEQLAEGVVMDLRDDKLYQVATIDGLQIFKENLKYWNGNVYPYDPNGCFYTADEIITGVCPDGWRVPTFKDIMHILNNIDLNNTYADLVAKIGFLPDGYVSIGTPLRHEWINVIGAMWIYWSEFHKTFTFRNMIYSPQNKDQIFINAEEELSEEILSSYGLNFFRKFATLANVRPVMGTVNLDSFTLLHGWNYINFNKLGLDVTGKTPSDVFGDDLEKVIIIKTGDQLPNKVYWRVSNENVVDQLNSFEKDRFYLIKVNSNLRIEL